MFLKKSYNRYGSWLNEYENSLLDRSYNIWSNPQCAGLTIHCNYENLRNWNKANQKFIIIDQVIAFNSTNMQKKTGKKMEEWKEKQEIRQTLNDFLINDAAFVYRLRL